MLKSLTLTNFKKHENLHIDFGSGFVALRGANEAGKSSIYHAIAYALYGSRALPRTVDGTVTYGKSPSTLKVVLVFTHGGVEYKITRSKSGALLEGNGITANGQSEVTGFIESLFRVDGNTAVKVMIAHQKSLEISDGSSAVALIEQLSNMDIIDTLIERIQSKLPSGNTAALEQLVAELQQAEKPMPNFQAQDEAVEVARAAWEAAAEAWEAAAKARDAMPVAEAQAVVREAEDRASQRGRTQGMLAEARVKLAEPAPPAPLYDAETLDAEWEAERLQEKRIAAYAEFKKARSYEDKYAGTYQELLQAWTNGDALAKSLTSSIQSTKTKLAVANAGKITDTSCALCGKLLTDVPEVVEVNAKVAANVLELEQKVSALQVNLEKVEADNVKYKCMASVHSENLRLLESIKDYAKPTEEVPCSLVWIGEPPAALSGINYPARIRENRKAAEAYGHWQARQKNYFAALETHQKWLEDHPPIDCAEEHQLLQAYAVAMTKVNMLGDTVRQMERTLQGAKHAKELAESQFKAKLDLYAQKQIQLANNKTLLNQYYEHNALIRKLRDIRPTIAKQLWNSILQAASSYFSQVRGQPSVITKSDKDFLVDGKPAADLSGSTMDSLGLAIRLGLQKTFLPMLDFMLLDEPASGCDDTREAAMLGVLASCGYNQVVLVTHSTLADTFAQQVVQI